MFNRKDEVDIYKLVTFYSIFTSVYSSVLLFMLYWTDWIYSAGKYKFNRVIIFIIAAELFKYISSNTHFRNSEYIRKHDDKWTFLKSISSRTKIKEGFKNIVVVLIMILVYFGIAILYGAEVFKKHEETFMFSSLLSVLTIFPACINLGSHSVLALVLGSKPINKLENLLYQNLYLTVLGAWLGAFVIPLDWDRPWQVWPIPCSFGAVAGFAFSHLVMIVKVKGGFKKRYKRNV